MQVRLLLAELLQIDPQLIHGMLNVYKVCLVQVNLPVTVLACFSSVILLAGMEQESG